MALGLTNKMAMGIIGALMAAGLIMLTIVSAWAYGSSATCLPENNKRLLVAGFVALLVAAALAEVQLWGGGKEE